MLLRNIQSDSHIFKAVQFPFYFKLFPLFKSLKKAHPYFFNRRFTFLRKFKTASSPRG